MRQKKAQIEVSFHWIYILIAGVVILLFFVGIIMKQKVVSEEKISGDVVRILESILVGAGVSEKTKNFVTTSGLMDYTFEFKCEGGYSGFGVKEGAFKDLPTEAIFAPKEIKTAGLILWSLPYKLPYKVMDLLMITSINTKYFVKGSDEFYIELQNATDGLNFEFDVDEMDPGNNFQVRIVDLSGGISEGGSVPEKLRELGDKYVTAVSFSGSKEVTYFQKDDDEWKQLGDTVQIISIAEEKDAAKYAAIFAGDGESYKCNMMKVFKRMDYLNEVYAGKLAELEDHFDRLNSGGKCPLGLSSLSLNFMLLDGKIGSCVNGRIYNLCDRKKITEHANALKTANKMLRTEPCIGLY